MLRPLKKSIKKQESDVWPAGEFSLVLFEIKKERRNSLVKEATEEEWPQFFAPKSETHVDWVIITLLEMTCHDSSKCDTKRHWGD